MKLGIAKRTMFNELLRTWWKRVANAENDAAAVTLKVAAEELEELIGQEPAPKENADGD